MDSDLTATSVAVDMGRVLENVHAQQSQIHGLLAALDARSRDLDAVVDESVQRAFIGATGLRAAETLSQVHRATGLRFALWSFGTVAVCSLVPAILSWTLMPSGAQLAKSRQSLEQMSANIAHLSREGGQIELRRCGEADRLCVRIDRKAPLYGEGADYAIVKGY